MLQESYNQPMKYLHTMVRVSDLDASLKFYRDALGLEELSRRDSPAGRFTLVFLAAPGDHAAQIELTYNWDPEVYSGGRNFGHVAYAVDDVYAACQRLQDHGVTILRPPRDGRMAFVRSPDGISIELLQRGTALAPQEPWISMPNTGTW
jgi:lactoylglutathione lyase